jgi:hypothetical protein
VTSNVVFAGDNASAAKAMMTARAYRRAATSSKKVMGRNRGIRGMIVPSRVPVNPPLAAMLEAVEGL